MVKNWEPSKSYTKEYLDAIQKVGFYNSISKSKDLLGNIQIQVLVLAGEKDQNAKMNKVISAYQMIPNSQLSIIPNVGHGLFLENFPAVWCSILPFIEENNVT